MYGSEDDEGVDGLELFDGGKDESGQFTGEDPTGMGNNAGDYFAGQFDGHGQWGEQFFEVFEAFWWACLVEATGDSSHSYGHDGLL